MAATRRSAKKATTSHRRPAKADVPAPMKPETLVREKLLLDFGWKFHLGHASDPASDFDFGANQRTYAKAGQGVTSCAAPDFFGTTRGEHITTRAHARHRKGIDNDWHGHHRKERTARIAGASLRGKRS